MTDIFIFDPFNRFMWVVVIIILLFCGAYLVFRGLKYETVDEEVVMLGIASLFLSLGFNRLFFFFSDFFINGNYIGHTFYGNYDDTKPLYSILIEIGYLSILSGFTAFFFTMEKVMKKTKYILTILNSVFIFLVVITPFDLTRTLIFILVTYDALVVVIFLIWFSKVSSKEFQAVSTLMMMGFILFLMGNLMDSNFLKRLDIFSPTVAAYWMIAGAVVVISPTFINPKLLSKSISNWAILSIFLAAILIQLISIIVGVKILPFFEMWLWISILIDSSVLIYSITRIIKLIKPPEILKKGEDNKKELLKIFTRPSRITEEEVAVHKEKKICLVCKGSALGYTFICSKCGAIYCSKCARSLSDLENVCWACDTTLDETKPVKRAPQEELKEEIVILGKGKKEN